MDLVVTIVVACVVAAAVVAILFFGIRNRLKGKGCCSCHGNRTSSCGGCSSKHTS